MSAAEFMEGRHSSEWAREDTRIREATAIARGLARGAPYELYTGNSYTDMRAQYLMLPAKRSARADLILVIGAPDILYSTSDGVLHVTNRPAGRVKLLAAPHPDICILERSSRP